jgi:hypothetical protein
MLTNERRSAHRRFNAQTRRWKHGVRVAVCATLFSIVGLAQGPSTMQSVMSKPAAPVTNLKIDIENFVRYDQDEADWSKLAINPNRATPLPFPAPAFANYTFIADIVAVNGKPAKGVYLGQGLGINFATNPNPRQAIADVSGTPFARAVWVILQDDGTPVGSIYVTNLQLNRSLVPGAPTDWLAGNSAVIGGTGAFLGVSGQSGSSFAGGGARRTSVTEDPANRRTIGGSKYTAEFHLIPMFLPEIAATTNGPAVTHTNNFTLVTPNSPARSGEILALYATGLGPTRPGVNPGQPFPATPLQVVNSPVEVTLNGVQAEVLYAGGYPGAVDGYQVNIRLPAGLTPGMASLQMKVAWIAGPEVKIAVQ